MDYYYSSVVGHQYIIPWSIRYQKDRGGQLSTAHSNHTKVRARWMVDGDPATANSKGPELAGYAASLEVLLMFQLLSPNFTLEQPLDPRDHHVDL